MHMQSMNNVVGFRQLKFFNFFVDHLVRGYENFDQITVKYGISMAISILVFI
jgi:hypothetical protein